MKLIILCGLLIANGHLMAQNIDTIALNGNVAKKEKNKSVEINVQIIDSGKEKMQVVTIDSPKSAADSIRKITIIQSKRDTVKVELPKKKTKEKWRRIDSYYGDLTVGGYLHNGNVSMPQALNVMELNYGKSVGVSFAYMQSRRIIGNGFRFAYGLGFESSNYRWDSHHRMEVRQGKLEFTDPNPAFKYSKTKLNVNYINIPLALEIRTKPNKYEDSFLFQFGAEGSLLVTSKFKQKYNDNGETVKAKFHDTYQLAPFRLSYFARMGYSDFFLFVRYTQTNMFQIKNNNPELNQFNIGLSYDF